MKPGTSNYAKRWGLPRPIIKTHTEKSGRGSGLAELPKIWGFPSIFTQWLKLATSHLVHGLSLPRPIIKSHP